MKTINVILSSEAIKKLEAELGSKVTLHRKRKRVIKVASLDTPQTITYLYAQYRHFDKKKNRYCYWTQELPNVTGKRQHDNSTILKVVLPVLKNEMTIKYAAEQGRDLLQLTTVPSTVWDWLQAVDIKPESYEEMQEKSKENLSGMVSVDEVYDKGNGIVIITDPVSNLIRLAHLYQSNITGEDIINDFNKLKQIGAFIHYCVRDASSLYQKTLQKVYEKIKLQLCLFHFIKNTLKCFLNWHRRIRKEVRQLPRGLQTQGTKLKKYLFQKRTLFVKKKLSSEEEDILNNIIDAIPEFGRLRELYLRFMNIFDAQNKEQAEKNLWDFVAEEDVSNNMPQLVKQLLKYHNKGELFAYLEYDKALWTKIRTSNHTERVNRVFRKKQKTHYRIRNSKSRAKLLRCMIYFHNAKSLGIDTKHQLIVNKTPTYLIRIF